jgi:hypothetical protein
MTDEHALRDFIARHARPYDPETDTYNRPPFAENMKEGKNNPIYSVHPYHTKVPPRGIVPYILHYTEPGDLILDPFCGSGMTGVAAQMCANPPADLSEQFPELRERSGPRHVILTDHSPAACHIAHNYNTPVDSEALQHEGDRIKETIKGDFGWLYGTEHYEPAVGLYDPGRPEVQAKLKDGLFDDTAALFDTHVRCWELITKSDVECRLGFSVDKLVRGQQWDNLAVSSIETWLCIPAVTKYTVWSDLYTCEGFVTVDEHRTRSSRKRLVHRSRVRRGCGKLFALWDAAVNLTAGEISSSFRCPHCDQPWEKRQLQKTTEKPVLTTYEYLGTSMNAKGVVAYRVIRKDRTVTALEARHLLEIATSRFSQWCPEHPVDMNREMMRHGMAKQGLSTIADFWTPRNRRALAILWAAIEATSSERVRHALQFAFTAIAFRTSRRRIVYCPKGGGWASTVISGTLYIPSLNAEANVAGSFEDKLNGVIQLAAQSRADDAVHVALRDATHLSDIPSESIDYVFADPPFGKNIYYADCSLLWESWLNAFTDESREIVINERRRGGNFKDIVEYGRLMYVAFSEIFRVLKPNRFLTIEFNNSDGRVFEVIKQAVLASGFGIVSMLLMDKGGKTYKQMKAIVSGENVVDKDVVFNAHKPEAAAAKKSLGEHDLDTRVADAVREHLKNLPERINADPSTYSDDYRTTATINSMLMNTFIPQEVGVDRLNLPFIERVCSRYFRKVGQRWYLRGEPVRMPNGSPQLIEEEVVVKDEVSSIEWLRQHVKLRPMLLGELKPVWMRATGLLPAEISRELVLEDLLTENFWREPDSNRWREPTAEERERMNDDRSIRVLHDAERFVAGSLRRSTDDSERCEWIDVIFEACKAIEEDGAAATPALRGFDPNEGYRLVGRLFQSVLRDRVSPAAYGRAGKQARVASQRLARQARQDTNDREPTLFD